MRPLTVFFSSGRGSTTLGGKEVQETQVASKSIGGGESMCAGISTSGCMAPRQLAWRQP
jgi:hypothetical protein